MIYAAAEIPLIYPRNIQELADNVRHIGDSGCIVRPVGAGHSMDNVSAAPDGNSGKWLCYLACLSTN